MNGLEQLRSEVAMLRHTKGSEREARRERIGAVVRALDPRPAPVMVCGSRHYDTGSTLVHEVLAACPVPPRVIMHGAAGGVDTGADAWASLHTVPVVDFPADWSLYGKAAGPIRNRFMRQLAECVVAVWDGRTEGCGTYDTVLKLQNDKVWCAWMMRRTEDYRVIVGVRWAHLGGIG